MFEQELAQLATAIREAVTKRRDANAIATRREVRVRRRNFGLKYHQDFAFGNFPPERIEQDIWDWRDQQAFHESFVKNLPEYKFLVTALGSQVDCMENFVRSISFESFHGLDDKEVFERASSLGRELDGQPLPVKVTAFIDGLGIGESPLVISDRFTLRQPAPEDLTEEILLDEYGGLSLPPGDTWFRVVGEFNFDATSTGFAQRELHRTVEALRLFRVGGIVANRYVMSSRHSFMGRGTLTSPNRASRFTYTLLRADAGALKKFIEDIVPLVPDPFRTDKTANEREIALSRYGDALSQEGPIERSITSAMTALEALFLEGEPELTHRLAQRVSLFLRALGPLPDAQSTYDKVKRGYKIRSIFIHGGSLTPKDRPQADSLAPDLLECARQCVLAFLQIDTPKTELLGQLDRAMIDPAGTNELMGSLATVGHR